MPRKPQMYLPGIPNHIIQRGNNRLPCYFAESDYRFYLTCLNEAACKYKVAIHAYALMRGKRISDMLPKGLRKKFKDKTFAAKIEREIIREAENLDLDLDEFFQIAVDGMKNIKEEVGLE